MDFTSFTPTELSDLYRKNPSTFNMLAADAIRQACIGKTPEQTLKLRQMQWTIDAHLRKAKTPLGKLHVMENIFYGRVYGSDGLLAKLVSAWDSLHSAANGPDQGAGKKPELRLLKK